MKVETMFIVIVGILVIGILEMVALANGINGVALAAAIAAITGIISATFTFIIMKVKTKQPPQE